MVQSAPWLRLQLGGGGAMCLKLNNNNAFTTSPLLGGGRHRRNKVTYEGGWWLVICPPKLNFVPSLRRREQLCLSENENCKCGWWFNNSERSEESLCPNGEVARSAKGGSTEQLQANPPLSQATSPLRGEMLYICHNEYREEVTC